MESIPLFWKMTLNDYEKDILNKVRTAIINTIEDFGQYLQVQKEFQFTYLTGATFDLREVIRLSVFDNCKFSCYHLTLSIMKLKLVIEDNSFKFPKYLYDDVKTIEENITLLQAIKTESYKRFKGVEEIPAFEFG